MKNRLVLVLVAPALSVTLLGCSSATPEAMTFEACKEKITEQLGADSYDWQSLAGQDLPSALKESGIPDPENEAEGMYAVFGDFGADDTTYSVVCSTEIVEGEAVVVENHPLITEK